MKGTCVALTMLLVSVSSALVRSYAVEPRSAAESGWTDTIPGQDYVSEVLTCCWDELDSAAGGYVELFVGENAGNGAYNIEVMDGATRVAYHLGRARGSDYAWLKFGDIQMEPGQSFTKGKQYEFRFTRSGAGRIGTGLDCGLPGITMA